MSLEPNDLKTHLVMGVRPGERRYRLSGEVRVLEWPRFWRRRVVAFDFVVREYPASFVFLVRALGGNYRIRGIR